MKKKRERGHWCWSCQQTKPNEAFSGGNHGRHLCRACASERRRAARAQRQAAATTIATSVGTAGLEPTPEQQLYDRVAAILDRTHTQIARTVNTAMVHAYWLVGREIVEVEQEGELRAAYGGRLIDGLAARRTARFGKAFGVATLRRMRAFYLAYPEGSAIFGVVDAGRIRSTPLIESDLPPSDFPPILSPQFAQRETSTSITRPPLR
ncbi:MAG: DUF1016 N-terminal domain-containing protein [Proteobacteria bacterium]|nr:DUF1016 N-terminal domain-containing protein [Pseudomonadota bacterium]